MTQQDILEAVRREICGLANYDDECVSSIEYLADNDIIIELPVKPLANGATSFGIIARYSTGEIVDHYGIDTDLLDYTDEARIRSGEAPSISAMARECLVEFLNDLIWDLNN